MSISNVTNIGDERRARNERRGPSSDDHTTAVAKLRNEETRYIRQLLDTCYARVRRMTPGACHDRTQLETAMERIAEDAFREMKREFASQLPYFITDALRDK